MRTDMREGFRVKFPLLTSSFNQNWDMYVLLEQLPNFRGNQFSDSRIVTCGQTDGKTDMANVTNGFFSKRR
jgi:hypothetical protein